MAIKTIVMLGLFFSSYLIVSGAGTSLFGHCGLLWVLDLLG